MMLLKMPLSTLLLHALWLGLVLSLRNVRACGCTARDRKGLLEVFKRLPLREDLLRDPVLGGDGDNIGVVFSPRVVGLMKPGKLRKKKSVSRVA